MTCDQKSVRGVTVLVSGVPPPPDHRAARWDHDAKQLESIVLATVHMWTLCQPKTIAVPMILRHFVATDVYDSMCELATSVGLERPAGHRNTVERSAGELYAGELYDMILGLTATNTLPKIVVSSLGLPMVPLATLTTRDEVSLSARLESLETGLKKLADSVTRVVHSGVRYQQPEATLAPSVQQPGLGGDQGGPVHGHGQQVHGQQVHGHLQQGDSLQIPVPSFAAVAAVVSNGGATLSEGAGGQNRQRQRLGSQGQGQKRERNGSPVGDRNGERPFQTVLNRRKRL